MMMDNLPAGRLQLKEIKKKDHFFFLQKMTYLERWRIEVFFFIKESDE